MGKATWEHTGQLLQPSPFRMTLWGALGVSRHCSHLFPHSAWFCARNVPGEYPFSTPYQAWAQGRAEAPTAVPGPAPQVMGLGKAWTYRRVDPTLPG